MVEDVGDLVRAPAEVHRHAHQAELRAGVVGDEELGSCCPMPARARRRGRSRGAQPVRDAVHAGVELGVGPLPIAVDDGQLVGQPRRPSASAQSPTLTRVIRLVASSRSMAAIVLPRDGAREVRTYGGQRGGSASPRGAHPVPQLPADLLGTGALRRAARRRADQGHPRPAQRPARRRRPRHRPDLAGRVPAARRRAGAAARRRRRARTGRCCR